MGTLRSNECLFERERIAHDAFLRVIKIEWRRGSGERTRSRRKIVYQRNFTNLHSFVCSSLMARGKRVRVTRFAGCEARARFAHNSDTVNRIIYHFRLLSSRSNWIAQVLATLHDYPCLSACIALVHYISACVRLAWKMVNHAIPYHLDQDISLGKFKAHYEAASFSLLQL